jgi:hypothetical protein
MEILKFSRHFTGIKENEKNNVVKYDTKYTKKEKRNGRLKE